jgi:hypothetical protein
MSGARVDRIALLLAELDNLVPLSARVSAGLTQALATISEAEEKRTRRGSGHPVRAAVDGDGDPQPHVDHDALEGYFHSLNRERRRQRKSGRPTARNRSRTLARRHTVAAIVDG